MRPFAYERAADATEAVALLDGKPDAMFLGGGTNLVDLMRLGVATPETLVDVSRVGSTEVEPMEGGGIRIGAAARNSDVAADPLVRERCPVLSSALLHGASGQLRNLATVGGNLLQRTRCLYFQDVTKPCNKREPGSGCPARDGEHRNLAILGWSEDCVATHPSDMAVALAALDATVHVHGRSGPLPVRELHRLPDGEPQRDTTLEHGELIVAIDVPPSPGRSTYIKVRERASFSFALVSVAALLDLTDGRVSDVRIALGGVAHKPWRAARAEEVLRGEMPSEALFRHAAIAELGQARPLRDNGYKVELARNTIVAALREVV
jgi:xanthine dehydrogenase YagS FAD-binding subunit